VEGNARCAAWALSTNLQLARERLPLRIVHLGTIWTVLFTEPGRYNWLLQYYLRAEGVTLSWVGTGRCLCSMDFTAETYAALQTKLVAAAAAMKQDGWWLTAEEHPEREKQMRKRLMGDLVASLVRVPKPLAAFYTAVMQRKDDDHHASHNHQGNQWLHLVSSSVFLFCYVVIFSDLTAAMCWGLAALFVRQFGHAVLEPACHDAEALLLGYTTPQKTGIVIGYSLIPLVDMALAGTVGLGGFVALIDTIALHWFRWTLFVVAARVAYLTWKHDFRIAMIWFVKLVTDPATDIVAYFPRLPQRA
jgi:glutamate-1-semialdehyde 2,1-aminomutase